MGCNDAKGGGGGGIYTIGLGGGRPRWVGVGGGGGGGFSVWKRVLTAGWLVEICDCHEVTWL